MDTVITLDSEAETTIRAFYLRQLSQEDMEFVSNWFLMAGISIVQAVMARQPHLTIRDVMNIASNGYDA